VGKRVEKGTLFFYVEGEKGGKKEGKRDTLFLRGKKGEKGTLFFYVTFICGSRCTARETAAGSGTEPVYRRNQIIRLSA